MHVSGRFSQSQSHVLIICNIPFHRNILLHEIYQAFEGRGRSRGNHIYDPPSKIILGKPKEWCSGMKTP